MKADLTRVTFDRRKHYSRVLEQQGRVTVDADPNEQTEILLHYLRTLAADVIGPYAAPALGGGFQLRKDDDENLVIGAGRYYVDGILVENEADCAYGEQSDYPLPPEDPLLKGLTEKPTDETYWVFLDVWERHVTSIEDPAIREVALGGPDTCSRSKVVWQVRALPAPRPDTSPNDEDPAKTSATLCRGPLEDLPPVSQAGLSAQVDPSMESEDPCALAPDSKYRGHENHLYRVEVHDPGPAGTATFKWSRDNGSAVAAWVESAGNAIEVASGRLFAGASWVELTDDVRELRGEPGVLLQVSTVVGATITIDSATSIPSTDGWINPKVRRWDQEERGSAVLHDGAVPIVERTGTGPHWINLEDGIQVQFEPDGEYRTGDYWLIPARVATGKLEWPQGDEHPLAIPPHGIVHHYAPLGFVWWNDGELVLTFGCRCEFVPRCDCFYIDLMQPGFTPHDTSAPPRRPGRTGLRAVPASPTTTRRPKKAATRRRKGGG